ncbi:MAG TPA: FHA domain-containing protein [Anaerolineae bacterium]|nr:FHA domain-containing protein [Anaerolineae bacterium]
MTHLIVKDGNGVWQAPLGRLLTIGRGRNNDLVLNSVYASRRHAWIWRQGDRFIIEDLGSTHGTYVNGRRVTTPRFLPHDDVIVMGDASLFFVAEPEPITERTPPQGLSQVETDRRFCPRCSAVNLPTASYCEHCGAPLPTTGVVSWSEDGVPTRAQPIAFQEPVIARPFPTTPSSPTRRSGSTTAWVLILLLVILTLSLLCILGMLAAYLFT